MTSIRFSKKIYARLFHNKMVSDTTFYTWAEIKKHNTDKDCWIVLHDDVLDVTSFLEFHPGGADTILGSAGGDSTDSFIGVGHSDAAVKEAQQFIIGKLHPSERAAPNNTASEAASSSSSPAPSNADGSVVLTKVALAVAVVGVAAYAYTKFIKLL